MAESVPPVGCAQRLKTVKAFADKNFLVLGFATALILALAWDKPGKAVANVEVIASVRARVPVSDKLGSRGWCQGGRVQRD